MPNDREYYNMIKDIDNKLSLVKPFLNKNIKYFKVYPYNSSINVLR